jgi:Cd2+/Zn2+-exporting ATPase
VEAARGRGVAVADPEDVVALTAEGVTGRVGGREVFVLKPAGARARGFGLDAAAEAWLLAAQQRGETAVVVAVDNRAVGVLALSDTIRPEAAELVRQLKRAGVERVVMLTGDNEATAQAIAQQVGITEVHAGLLPAHKVRRVAFLREIYGTTIMVGDGINDAPALAAASVGIAMGTRGSDAALAAADVALMADDLSKLEEAVLLGRKTRRIIAQNLVLSGLIVVVLVAGTLFGDLSMFGAVLGHEGSEVFIVLNGLRAALR